jgi:hypothetical protein
MQEAMQKNQTLLELDLRLTYAGQESEHNINKILKINAENDRNTRIEMENHLYRSFNRTFSHVF